MRRTWRDLIVMLMCGYLGLGFPDVDLALLPILHHRSIITHSILIPAIFLTIRNSAIRFGAGGFILGISIHLSADVLSSPIGFGMIWLPWPIKFPLGPLSPLWLAANALVGLIWAKALLFKPEQRAPIAIYLLMALVLGPSYAIFHENSLIPLVSFALVFGLSFVVTNWIGQQSWFRRLPQGVALPPPSRDPT